MVNLQTVTLLIYQRTFLVLELLIECSSSPSLKWLFIYFSEIDLHPLHPSLSYSLPDIGFHSLTVEKYGSCRLSARWMEVALKTEIAEKKTLLLWKPSDAQRKTFKAYKYACSCCCCCWSWWWCCWSFCFCWFVGLVNRFQTGVRLEHRFLTRVHGPLRVPWKGSRTLGDPWRSLIKSYLPIFKEFRGPSVVPVDTFGVHGGKKVKNPWYEGLGGLWRSQK